MGKVKNYDKSLYPSVYDAIYEIMDKHLLTVADISIYSSKAFDEVCLFLAENDIKHQYTILSAPAGAECDEIISLMWVDGASYGNEVWYSHGKTSKKDFHIKLAVRAYSLDEVEDWVSTVDFDNVNIDIKDWSVDEV